MAEEIEGDLDLADINVTEPPAVWKPEEVLQFDFSYNKK